ncbi:YqzE family protein [Tepidibacillus marianensis]
MKSNDFVKFLTVQFVERIEQPKRSGKLAVKEKKNHFLIIGLE